MFSMKNSDKADLCNALAALIEEWGSERISVHLPGHWSRLGRDPLGALRVEFDTIDTISIHVRHENTGKLVEHDCADTKASDHGYALIREFSCCGAMVS